MSMSNLTVSVIVPCRNEMGTIEMHAQQVPEMGSSTEIIFVEGNSQDETWNEILRVIAMYPDKRMKAIKQPGRGKADAVRAALAQATGDLCIIFDGDFTVPAQSLQDFYDQLNQRGMGTMLNGTRFFYPISREAMPFFNRIANRGFAFGMSIVMRQRHTDMLCGTKAFFKSDYEKIRDFWEARGSFDPFGDFDLLFGAQALGMRIYDVPVRYQPRQYGAPNIRRWRHGLQLMYVFVRSVFVVGRVTLFSWRTQ